MRINTVVLVLVSAAAAVSLAGCGDPKPSNKPAAPVASSTSPTPPPARAGQAFRSGAFELVVTGVEPSVSELPLDETAKSGGLQPFKPKNGKFVLVHLTAKNVGNDPTTMSSTNASITDAAGKTYSAAGPFLGGLAGQGLDKEQQPGTTTAGFVVFDVPATAGPPTVLTIQAEDGATAEPPSRVALS